MKEIPLLEKDNLKEIRCEHCKKLLGYINGEYAIKCQRCGFINKN